MKTRLSFLFLMLSCCILQAQDILENNPPSLRWYQVNTDHFRVLYLKGFEVQAQRMANTLESLHAAEAKSLGPIPRKITVLMQNQSSVSNGFVSMFPRRSEFYTMPPQDYNFLGTNDWLNLLATHEYRHIVQYQHARRGLTKGVYYLFGNPTFAAVAQMAAPPWFWEGDAVATETAFTPSGRGKIPNFGLVFKSNLMEGRTFHYNKQHLRSYKHFIPDHYVLGYHMVSYLRKKTNDPEIFGKITRRSWNMPFIPFAFSNAIKRETGMTVSALYRDMAASLKAEWKNEIESRKISTFENVNVRRTKAYTDYLYPQPQSDGSVIAWKKGIGDIDQFVRLKDGEEKHIFTPGFVNESGMLSAHADAILWNEFGYDPRWRARNYSLVKIYETKTHKKRVIGGKRERLGSAVLSADGSKIAAVRTTTDYKTSVVVFELFTGKQIFEYSVEGEFYAMPRWSPDGTKIVVLRTTTQGKTISAIDVNANTISDYLPITHENVGHPVLHGTYLFFNSPISGVDNIYALDLSNKQRLLVTNSKYGAYNPAISADGKHVYYNDQSKDGMDIVRIPFDPTAWAVFNEYARPSSLASTLVEQEHHQHILDSVPQNQLSAKRYTKISGLLNPYSWGFNVLSNDFSQLLFGITSRDLLSTTQITAGYVYDSNERTGLIRAGVSYQGLYPIIDLTVETGDRDTDRSFYKYDAEQIGRRTDIKTTWNETTVEGGIRVPLVLTNSKYMQDLSIGTAVGLTRSIDYENSIYEGDKLIYQGPSRIAIFNDSLRFIYKDDLNNGDLIYNRISLSYAHVMKTSYRDFLYRWGQTFSADVMHTPFGGDFQGYLWAVRSTLYFPGILKHHYLYFRGGYQESRQGVEGDLYTFRNRISKPRGYAYPADEKFASLSANYAFPLWYPDVSIGPLLNIQRIKANAFVDYGNGSGYRYFYHTSEPEVYVSLTDAKYLSTGAEVTVDFNVMRLTQKFELGFRATYLAQTNRYHPNTGMVYEFLIGNIGF
ncbi:TolB-like translocation protein [Pseudochryseolinea flava]|uniref:Biopolymer transporter Tol n=1 Tax=Pseudochryseolinea flava TaxID=2059302 RepID=A0A364XYV0_9BACT|nr:PD40 domain-containing protein [Pseudochryseolinea flava]RAV98609.1 hypothetical protein DQQ10_23020 [Pseudochryseolinea flava]